MYGALMGVGMGGWRVGSIFSNLTQEEAIFLVLDGQINTAFQPFISAL